MPEACSTAMLLAAGKGERMRPLTLETTKPLAARLRAKPLSSTTSRLAAAGSGVW
jgi:dTDP-glucose pyrophosphorylase